MTCAFLGGGGGILLSVTEITEVLKLWCYDDLNVHIMGPQSKAVSCHSCIRLRESEISVLLTASGGQKSRKKESTSRIYDFKTTVQVHRVHVNHAHKHV